MTHYSDAPSGTNSMMNHVVLGMILGGVLTALLTPKKGEDVREFIKHRAQSMKKEAKDATEELRDEAVGSDPL